MVKKFKSTFALTAILMVTVLLAGCIGGGTKTFTLTVNIEPEGAATVTGVADKYDEEAVAQFTLEAAEGYEFVEWTGDDKPVYNDEKEVWEIVMDGDKTLTAVFKEIEEEPVDPEPVADEEAAAVVDAQIMALDKEVGLVQYKKDVVAARAAYEALNAETKALVTKLALLEAHEDQLDKLLYGEVTEFVIAEKVMDGIDLTADVLEDITLGSNFTYDGTVYQVTWESDKPEIIGADGTVNRPYGDDVEVTLTATLDFIGTLSADQKNVFEIKLNVVGIRFDLAVENGSVTATLNDLTGLDAVTADDFAIEFAVAEEAVEAEDLKVEYKDGVATWTFTPFERGLEDYKVDIAVTFGEFEEKDSLEFVGLAVIVETVGAINANTISVTFTGEDAPAEAVEVTLEEALVDGQTEVTFVYEGKTYTANLDTAYVSPVTAATAAVEKAEGSLLEKDLADARELVDGLAASDAKVLLDNRLDLVQNRITNIIADVEAARSAGNEVALFNLLNKAPFVNADADLISNYLTALNGNTGTIAEIQAVIDAENAAPETDATIQLVDDAVTAVNAAIANPNGDNGAVPPVKLITLAQEAIDELPATISDDVIAGAATTVTETVKADLQKELNDVKVVAPVLDATNQINLLKALQNNSFKRVNADLIAAYDTALDGSQITISDIQTEIDDANLAAAKAAVTTAQGSLATADVTKAQKLVNNISDDVAEKATEQDKLDRVNALITLKNAKTEAQVLAALKSEVLALDDINDAIAADYKIKLDGLTLSNTTDLQADVVAAGNEKAVGDAVAAVVTNFPTYDETKAADQTKALEELNRLATVSADVDADSVQAALIEDYIDAIATDIAKGTSGKVDWTSATDADKAGAVQTLVTEVNNGANETARTAAVNAATTPAEMRTALTAVASAENTTAYLNLPAQVKLEVASLVLDARNGEADKKFDDTAAITTAIGGASSGAIKAHADKLATVNGQVTAGSEIADVKTALDNFGYKAYTDLDAVARLAVAEAFLNSLPVDADGTPVALDYKTIAALQADIDKAIAAPAPMSVQAK